MRRVDTPQDVVRRIPVLRAIRFEKTDNRQKPCEVCPRKWEGWPTPLWRALTVLASWPRCTAWRRSTPGGIDVSPSVFFALKDGHSHEVLGEVGIDPEHFCVFSSRAFPARSERGLLWPIPARETQPCGGRGAVRSSHRTTFATTD